jgi:hypothetical protein
MSSEQPIVADAQADSLTANELQQLADMNLELASRYEQNAVYMENDEGRRIALTLSRWRRRRGRYFRRLSAEVERAEAGHTEWAKSLSFARRDPSACEAEA